MLHSWSNEEKCQLLAALEEYGSGNHEAISQKIPTKTYTEVRLAIGMCEKTAIQSIKDAHPPVRRLRKAPIDQWLEYLRTNLPQDSNGVNDLAVALKFIALFENRTKGSDINLTDCYEYLSGVVTGTLPKQLDSNTLQFVMANFEHFCKSIMNEDTSKEAEFMFGVTNSTQRIYASNRPTIVSDPKLNSLKVPLALLKISQNNLNSYCDKDKK